MSFFLNTTVCGFSLYHILAFFLIYSCLGWCVEVVYAAATTGQLVNRGFLNGPVCPIYGFGMILVLFFLTPLEDNLLLLYLGGVILPSALELVGGWALYKLYRTRWWDYTGKPFGPMPALMATAEYVTKVHAICVRCGNLAHHSHRLTQDEKLVVLGETDSYEAICRHCFKELVRDKKEK